MSVNLSDVEARLFSPQNSADIVRGTNQLAMSLSGYFNLTPEEVSDLLADLDDSTANAIAYFFGNPDGRVVKAVGEKLRGK